VLLWVPDPIAPLRHIVEFTVRLRPKGWTRAQPFLKGGKMIRIVKTQGDRDWQAYYRECWLRAMSRQGLLGLFPWEGPVIMSNYFLYHPPKNWFPGKEKTSTPDDDNLAKQVADALAPKGKGLYGAFVDDRQIIARSTAKYYHTKGDAVSTRLYLYENVEKPKRGRKAPKEG